MTQRTLKKRKRTLKVFITTLTLILSMILSVQVAFADAAEPIGTDPISISNEEPAPDLPEGEDFGEVDSEDETFEKTDSEDEESSDQLLDIENLNWAPEVPTYEELKIILERLITVHCINENESHPDMSYALLKNSYKGSLYAFEAPDYPGYTEYFYDLVIYPDEYNLKYSEDLDLYHGLAPCNQSIYVLLNWNFVTCEWELQYYTPNVFDVDCTYGAPDIPELDDTDANIPIEGGSENPYYEEVQPASTSEYVNNDIPETGDDTELGIYISVLSISILTLLIFVRKKKPSKK